MSTIIIIIIVWEILNSKLILLFKLYLIEELFRKKSEKKDEKFTFNSISVNPDDVTRKEIKEALKTYKKALSKIDKHWKWHCIKSFMLLKNPTVTSEGGDRSLLI